MAELMQDDPTRLVWISDRGIVHATRPGLRFAMCGIRIGTTNQVPAEWVDWSMGRPCKRCEAAMNAGENHDG